MAGRLIRIKLNTDLYGEGYFTDVKKPLGNIIFLAGLPGLIGKTVLAEKLCQIGYNIIQPFYYGSYSSNKHFSVRNSFLTLEDTVNAIEKNTIINLFSEQNILTNKNPIFLMGQSYGTNIIQSFISIRSQENLNLLNQITKKIVLISPVPTIPQFNESFQFNPKEFLTFIERAYPFCYRFENLEKIIDEFTLTHSLLNKITLKPSQNQQILHVIAKNDYIPKITVDNLYKDFINLKQIVIPGGHSLDSMDQNDLTVQISQFLSD
jgi:hypothetical protein